MLIHFLVAVAMAQLAEPETFAETEGWSIARHAGGCLMTREFGGDGNTILTFAVDPADGTAPLTILVGNSGWSFADADEEGYQIEFSNGAVWNDLAARTFTIEDSGDGVISIGFAQDALAPMLEDVADADAMRLSHRGVTVDRVSFAGSHAAVGTLGQCVRSLPESAGPALDSPDGFRHAPLDRDRSATPAT